MWMPLSLALVFGAGCSLALDFEPLAAAGADALPTRGPDDLAPGADATVFDATTPPDEPTPPDAVTVSACARAGGRVEPATGDCFVALHDRLRTFPDAHAACADQGGELASLRSAEEQAWAAWTMRAPNYYWIGLSDGVAEGTFTWADGAALAFTAWNVGEPNDGGGVEDCALVEFGFADGPPTWNDAPCDAEVFTLCRIPGSLAARWFR